MVTVGLGAAPRISGSGAWSSCQDLAQLTSYLVSFPAATSDTASPFFSSFSRVNTAVWEVAVSTWPDKTLFPAAPGTALKSYQATSAPLTGTCITPSRSTPRATRGASTLIDGIRRRDGPGKAALE